MSRRVRTIATLGVYLALALAATWPLCTRLASHVPTGRLSTSTVPLLNLWTLAWNVNRINCRYTDYWQAPIFHPTPDAFALSEPQPLMGGVAWVFSRLLTIPVIYNLLVISSLVLNGWFGQRFLHRMRLAPWIAAFGGAMIVLLPVVHWQLGVFQLIPIWGMLWALESAERFGRAPSFRVSCEMGLACAATYLLCVHHALFLSVVLIPALCWVWLSRRRSLRQWARIVPGLVIGVVIIGPLAWTQMKALERMQLVREAPAVRTLSVAPSGFLHTCTAQLFPPAVPRTAISMSPGSLKWGLALCGVIFGLTLRRRRRVVVYLFIVLAVSAFLATGPRVSAAQFSPYRLLVDYYPGFAQVRSYYRFAYLTQVAVCLLAGLGVHGILIGTKSFNRRFAVAIAIVIACLATVETVPRPLKTARLPTAEPAWSQWVIEHTEPDDVLVFLPLPQDRRASSFEGVARQMYWQPVHGRAIVNGYSGFLPPAYQRLAVELTRSTDATRVAVLRASSADYCVVAAGYEIPQGLELVHRDPREGTKVYRITRE